MISMINTAISRSALIYLLTNVINVFNKRTNVFSITDAVIKSRDKRPDHGIFAAPHHPAKGPILEKLLTKDQINDYYD